MPNGNEVKPMSKRRKGFPSERSVDQRGATNRLGVEFQEKLGREDPCPCKSGKKFKNCHMRNRLSPWKIGDPYER